MPIESKFIRCDEDDPRRCQAVAKKTQCPYKAVDNSDFCPMHQGPVQANKEAAASKRMYNLAKWQNRVGEIADHEQIKSLREEIGITRMLLEGVVQQCNTQSDLLMFSGKIGDLVLKIEKLVSSCHRLEQSTGFLMDKGTALNLGSQIVEIISRHVTDDGALEIIGNEIIDAILKTQKDK